MTGNVKWVFGALTRALRALLAASLAGAVIFTLVFYAQAYVLAMITGAAAPQFYGLILFLAIAFILTLPMAFLAVALAVVTKHVLALEGRIAAMGSAGSIALCACAIFGTPQVSTLVALTTAVIAGCEAHIWFRCGKRPETGPLIRRVYAVLACQCGGIVPATPGKRAMRWRQADSAGNRLSNWS